MANENDTFTFSNERVTDHSDLVPKRLIDELIDDEVISLECDRHDKRFHDTRKFYYRLKDHKWNEPSQEDARVLFLDIHKNIDKLTLDSGEASLYNFTYRGIRFEFYLSDSDTLNWSHDGYQFSINSWRDGVRISKDSSEYFYRPFEE